MSCLLCCVSKIHTVEDKTQNCLFVHFFLWSDVIAYSFQSVYAREVGVHPGGSGRGNPTAAGASPHSCPVHENSEAKDLIEYCSWKCHSVLTRQWRKYQICVVGCIGWPLGLICFEKRGREEGTRAVSIKWEDLLYIIFLLYRIP